MTSRPPIDLTSHADHHEELPEEEMLGRPAHVSAADALLARRLALGGFAAVVISVLAIAALHVLPPTDRLDPLSRTISEYALMSTGWIFDAGVVLLSLGSAAVLVAIVLRGLTSWRSAGVIMTAIWSIALIGLVLFPKQGFGSDPSVAGRVHWTWTLIAFFSLPIGTVLLCWSHRAGAQHGRWPRWAIRLAWWAAGWFVVLAGQTLLSATTKVQAWRLVGLVERALSLTEMATVLMLALWVLAVGRADLRPPRAP